MKVLVLLSLLLISGAAMAADQTAAPAGPLAFQLTDIEGKPYALSQHLGKAVLLVNVASKCGLTPQYDALEKLHQAYKDKGLVVIGIPANNFGGQEPGTEAEIRTFCTNKYHVTFPMMAKVSVKGADICPLYAWLTTKSAKPGEIEWNFAKFLVGRDGQLAARFAPKTTPDSDEVKQAVEAALAAK
jgi:glutathione peroxidase